MSLVLSAPKIVLLAAHLAAKADLDSLSCVAAQHGSVLRKELLLRILLTYLPETLKSEEYVSFLDEIERGEYVANENWEVDISAVEHLTEEEAVKKVRKLHLLKLSWPEAPGDAEEDPLTLFLLRRSYKVDEEAGLLDQLPDLLAPFLNHSPCIRTWTISVLLPLLRRNYEYYPNDSIPITLTDFEHLDDPAAVDLLLSQTGAREEDYHYIARDLRGLLGPWLYNDQRWTKKPAIEVEDDADEDGLICPGWEQMLVWLTAHASSSWRVAVEAVDHWHSPEDVDLGGYGQMWYDEEKQQYLEHRYARAAMASAYLIPEASTDALTGAYTIVLEVTKLLDEPLPPLQTAASNLSPVPDLGIRRAGELALLQDELEQKTEALKLIHAISEHGPNSDDKFWIRARNEILWLRDWGAEEESPAEEDQYCTGIFGRLSREFLEVEILKALLAHTRYSLAKSLYEDSAEQPLPEKVLRDTVYAAAMNAYDNASNPNRTRGGVKKCNDIIQAFPKSIERSVMATQRIEALLKATHALSDYRLVLKQGEPFTPVVLRVHQDPISIIGKVLEQNPKSYTRIQDLVDVGRNMVVAGLTVKDKSGHCALTPETEPEEILTAEKRVTAMCIDSALTEDDFETAYSYVVNRLAALWKPSQTPVRTASDGSSVNRIASVTSMRDDWSWRAALQAGKYRRTARTVRPTHLGTASGNPEIRHLEQRIECLATALRVAPTTTLPEILNNYRRTEEELDTAIKAEQEQEHAWDAAADLQTMPGGFNTAPRNATVAVSRPPASTRHNAEEAPMSLFDLSRASMRSAQRNLTALSNFNLTAQGRASDSPQDQNEYGDQQQRARKRDQLREAAMGGLTAGVGWLIGAQPAQPVERDHEGA
ncbi:Protein transport protein sec39 [Cytospora mali]|uniref:Protein transport protein sec39 n=1 Tax=Cytospora mali TaxID=578113 RepID=A0A194UYW1_CYTMA|nr:Protein transport protein sec39 [Valsa mali var. pyri (nom. inval.)]